MAVLKCSTCTAPLDVEGHETFVLCKYCKSRNRVMRTVQGPQLVKVSPRAMGRVVLILVLAFVVLPIVATLVAIVVIGAGTVAVVSQASTHGPTTMPMPMPHFPMPMMPAAPARVTPSQLATLTGAVTTEIDAPGMVGTLASFDPSANLGWARSI